MRQSLYADEETPPSWWENTHDNLIGCLFIIHLIYFNKSVIETKEGIKILVYSSVIDINQMDAIYSFLQ